MAWCIPRKSIYQASLAVSQSPMSAMRSLAYACAAAKASVIETTARDTDIDPVYLEPAFDQVLDLDRDGAICAHDVTISLLPIPL